jgi:hypothetical protein
MVTAFITPTPVQSTPGPIRHRFPRAVPPPDDTAQGKDSECSEYRQDDSEGKGEPGSGRQYEEVPLFDPGDGRVADDGGQHVERAPETDDSDRRGSGSTTDGAVESPHPHLSTRR